MRFSQVSLLLSSAVGLSQGLALPQTSPALESRNAATQLRKLFARDFECDIDDKTQCTSCPDIELNGDSVKARADIPMNAIGSGEWKGGDVIETHGLSVCTAVAVWDNNHWIMAHIPPAREGNDGELAATGEDLINEYLGKMEERYNEVDWDNAEGYILMSSYLDEDLQKKLADWYDDKGIPATKQLYTPDEVIAGSGNLAISREAGNYPPNIYFL
ncbi:hypothetical protein F5Y09DRAFT_347529 [Xylaria sp. FL1042]|nr:hypothetical protein F5Y09DRAFT_347529 [Xylaria sp. FL1042]